jgi:putative transposase
MTYTFIAGRCSDLPVATCCRVMKVSTPGFYQWPARPCSDRDYADAVLTNTIIDIHRMSRRSYGSPRVHAELRLGPGPTGAERTNHPGRLRRAARPVGSCHVGALFPDPILPVLAATRDLFEERLQQDRTIEVLERIEAKLERQP